MGLSDCECGGFIALGPDASNKCDKCGAGPFGFSKPREPFAWWLIGGTDIFLASDFTPDTEHRDEWCPLYR